MVSKLILSTVCVCETNMAVSTTTAMMSPGDPSYPPYNESEQVSILDFNSVHCKLTGLPEQSSNKSSPKKNFFCNRLKFATDNFDSDSFSIVRSSNFAPYLNLLRVWVIHLMGRTCVSVIAHKILFSFSFFWQIGAFHSTLPRL